MVDARDVDFNSSWARLPSIVGPMAGTSLDDCEDGTDTAVTLKVDTEAVEPSGCMCGYCSTLTWRKIAGQLHNRSGMTLRPTYGDMLRRSTSCPMCRVLAKSLKDANPDAEIDPSYKLVLTPIGQSRKHRHRAIFALGVNPVSGKGRRTKSAGTTEPNVEAGTMSVFIDDNGKVDPELSEMIAGRQVRRAVDIRTVMSWMDECRSNHLRCKDNTLYKTHSMSFANDTHPRKILPRRTVFIPEDEADENVYLQEHDGERADYVALSYCWGSGATMVRTLRETREEFMKGVKISVLPKTFQDAIYMTRKLGVRHLWIDSLCIIQDDKGDWANEANLMGRLYAGSLLTIAALSSSTADGGLYFERQLEGEVCSIPFSDAESDPNVQVYFKNIPSLTEKPVQLEEEAHSKRAWTLQERLLSPRVIYCAKLQYYWECREMKAVEDGSVFPEGIMMMPKHRPGSLIGSLAASKSPRDALDLWYEVIRTYSWRQMTYAEDKLTALDGLVKTFAPNINARYIDGIWATDLSQALAWRRSRRCPALTKPKAPRAATWSWASVDGGLNYLNQRVYYHKPLPAWRNLLWKPDYLQSHSMAVIRVTAWVLTDEAARTVKDLLQVRADIFLDDGSNPSAERPEPSLSCVALAEPTSDERRAHVLLLSYDDAGQSFGRIGIADVRDFVPLKSRMMRREISLA